MWRLLYCALGLVAAVAWGSSSLAAVGLLPTTGVTDLRPAGSQSSSTGPQYACLSAAALQRVTTMPCLPVLFIVHAGP